MSHPDSSSNAPNNQPYVWAPEGVSRCTVRALQILLRQQFLFVGFRREAIPFLLELGLELCKLGCADSIPGVVFRHVSSLRPLTFAATGARPTAADEARRLARPRGLRC